MAVILMPLVVSDEEQGNTHPDISPIWSDDCGLCFEEAQAVRQFWFNKIAPSPWKSEIRCEVAAEEVANLNAAAIYFTGGGLEVIDQLEDGKVVVYGKGYYHYIGA